MKKMEKVFNSTVAVVATFFDPCNLNCSSDVR